MKIILLLPTIVRGAQNSTGIDRGATQISDKACVITFQSWVHILTNPNRKVPISQLLSDL